MNPIDEIADLFAGEGAGDYLGESVTMSEHMRQAGDLARAAGARDPLVAAALLHDVGHFHGAVTGRELMAGADNHHGDSGADWLCQWFGLDVCEPVRLHVAAKRYLCATEPDYFAQLSPASVFTLSVQGGPMSSPEARNFESLAHAEDAIAVRRWDDQAKDPARVSPLFEDFRPLLEGLRRTS